MMEDRNCGCNNQEFMKGECKFETPQRNKCCIWI